MTSPCVLEGILQLSAAFSGRPIEVVERRGVGALHLQAMSSPLDAKSPSSALRLMAGFVLVRTLFFVQDVPDTWEPSFHGGAIPPSLTKFDFIDATQRRTWFSFLVLISRLGTLHIIKTVGVRSLFFFDAPTSSFAFTHSTLFIS